MVIADQYLQYIASNKITTTSMNDGHDDLDTVTDATPTAPVSTKFLMVELEPSVAIRLGTLRNFHDMDGLIRVAISFGAHSDHPDDIEYSMMALLRIALSAASSSWPLRQRWNVVLL